MSNQTAVLDETMIESPQSPRAILSSPFEARAGKMPKWFREQQQPAWTKFESLPYPNLKDQAWRFSNVNALDLSSFNFGAALSQNERDEILDRSLGLNEVAGRLIFADNHLLRRDPLPQKLLTAGVILKPLERAILEHEDLFRRHFMVQPATLGSAKFAAVHEAFVYSGTFVYVPRGVEVELPIEIFHWLHGENVSVFPHTLLIADELAKVTVIEHFQSAHSDRAGFACGVNDLVVGRGAKLNYACTQNWNEKALAVQINSTSVERDAAALSLNVHLGGAYTRFEGLSRLSGEEARSDILAVCVASDTRNSMPGRCRTT